MMILSWVAFIAILSHWGPWLGMQAGPFHIRTRKNTHNTKFVHFRALHEPLGPQP